MLTSLDLVRPRQLTASGRVDAVMALEKLIGWAQAQQYRVLALMFEDPSGYGAVAGPDTDKQWAREDVQAALGINSIAASNRLATADELVHRLPATLAMLETGELSADQARTVADAVMPLPDAAAQQVQAEALHHAQLPLPAFRRAVRSAVITADPDSVDRQRKQGVADRRVVARAEAPGVTSVWALLPAEDAAALMTAVQQLAGSFDPADGRTADQRRADALTELALNHLGLSTDSVEAPSRGLRPTVAVTVALSTLLGLDEHCGELDGHGPIPAALARALAGDQTGTWRRLVTDERGVLLDYGRSTYRPPADLRRFVQARDRICRFPGCSHPANRCELDHLVRWADGGTTDQANLHALSGRHHHAKDDHGWRPTRRPDGTTEWTSPTGHTYLVPPATYPLDRTLTGPASTDDADEPPPF